MLKLFGTTKNKSMLKENIVSPCLIAPIKVVVANCDYYDPDKLKLEYKKGDYLHIISETATKVGNGFNSNWYQACNPITNEIGLVYINDFTIIEKSLQKNQNEINYCLPFIAVALADFDAEMTDELSIKMNEKLLIHAESTSDWLIVQSIEKIKSNTKLIIKGLPGLVPKSYLYFIDLNINKKILNLNQFLSINQLEIPDVKQWKSTYFKDSESFKSTTNSIISNNNQSSLSSHHSSLDNKTMIKSISTSSILKPSPLIINKNSLLETKSLSNSPKSPIERNLSIDHSSCSSSGITTPRNFDSILSFNTNSYMMSPKEPPFEEIECKIKIKGIEYKKEKYYYKIQLEDKIIYKIFEEIYEFYLQLIKYLPLKQFHLPLPEDYITLKMCEERIPKINQFFKFILELNQFKVNQLLSLFLTSSTSSFIYDDYVKVKLIMKNEIVALKLKKNFTNFDLHKKICDRFGNRINSLFYLPHNCESKKHNLKPLELDLAVENLIHPISGKIVIYAD